MKKWAVLMLALLLAVNAGMVRAEAAKDTTTEKYAVAFTGTAPQAPEPERTMHTGSHVRNHG